MIEVCHLGKDYPPAPGGIETNVRILARAQADLGAQVQVFCVNHRPGPTSDEADGPVAVRASGGVRGSTSSTSARGSRRP